MSPSHTLYKDEVRWEQIIKSSKMYEGYKGGYPQEYDTIYTE